MEYSKQVIDKIQEEYENKRIKAENDLLIRKAEMYSLSPILKEIDEQLDRTGIKVLKEAMNGSEGLESRIEVLKKETKELKDDKSRILKHHGKSENYLDIHFACEKCSDTGYVGLNMCECMKKALINESYTSSGLGAFLKEQSFDNFDLEFYRDKAGASKISDKENMTFILREAKAYVKNFGKDEKVQNLLFVGKTGLGKTHISTSIAKGVIEKGYSVVYDTVSNIISNYEKQTFGHDPAASAETEKYNECSLLIIDDLGTELKNSFTQSVIYNLLNSRIVSGKAMIISTNLDDSELYKKQYDDRINSRLIGNFRTFKFVGEDIRIKKLKKSATKKN